MTRRLCVVGILLVLLASPCLAFHGERSLLFQDFEAASPPALPAGWAAFNPAGDTGAWEARPYGGVPWGVQCVRYRSDPLMPADDWVFTAAVTLSAGVPYDLSYLVRCGATATPMSLEVFAGTTPTPGAMTFVVLPIHPITNTTYTEETGVFVPPASGTYHFGWHVLGPPAAGRLFVDDVDVTTPETGLKLSLGLARELDLVPLVFTSSDTVDVCVYIENLGAATEVLNTRFTVGRYPSKTELDFYITGPMGRLPVINLFEKLGQLKASDFAPVAPGEVAGKTLNLWSWYEFNVPGEYVIEAHYRNYSDPGALGAWQGELVADPVTITIE
jgi:hypothetical protein